MPDAPLDPLSALRRGITEALASILAEHQYPADSLRRLPLRFRPDGKGGELASPVPMALHLDAQLLADALNQSQLPIRVVPSGGWLAIHLTREWEETVRHFQPAVSSLDYNVPPPPAFSARIDPMLWRLDALIGITDPSIAARLDRGNPAFRAYWAGLQCPREGTSLRLINECALLYATISSADAPQTGQQMVALADAYLAAPAEGALVQRALQAGWHALEI